MLQRMSQKTRPPERASGAPTAGFVEIYQLSIEYAADGAKHLALAPTDLNLEPGSFVSIIGPSGCGKSTLLNAVGGFVKPSSGFIRVDGTEVRGPNPDVGVIFQQYALFPWFTALGNIKFALRRFGLARAELHEKAIESLREVGLEEHAGKYPGQLSGGMKQRVAVARTLAQRPKVLLMDEPFGALDAQTRLTMHELLMRILEVHRSTVLLVTHDVDEALLLSDVVYIMSSAPGRIVRSIEIDELRPRSVERSGPEYFEMRSSIIRMLRGSEDDTNRP